MTKDDDLPAELQNFDDFMVKTGFAPKKKAKVIKDKEPGSSSQGSSSQAIVPVSNDDNAWQVTATPSKDYALEPLTQACNKWILKLTSTKKRLTKTPSPSL